VSEMRTKFPIRVFVALFSAMLAVSAAAGKAPATPPASAKPAQAEKGETVAYDDLHLHVGQNVIVHTTYKSTRSGVLMKVSKVELTLGIDTPDGSSQLTIPKDTVASVVVLAAPEPAK